MERLALTDEGTAPFLPSRFAADDEQRTRLVFSTADVHARLGFEHEGGAPLLIFDQFEEFVTLFEEAPENREKFAEAAKAQNTLLEFFRDLLRDETLPVKLLFVFREDYLAKLSKLFALVPNLRDQHVRLTFPDSSVLKKLIRGPFTSEMLLGAAKSDPGYLDMVAGGTLQRRVAEPWEIASVIVFLCSDRAAYVTGSAWSADGGTVPIII